MQVVCETGSKAAPTTDATVEVHQNQPSSSSSSSPQHREKRPTQDDAKFKKAQDVSGFLAIFSQSASNALKNL
jgi:hypothetical protein